MVKDTNRLPPSPAWLAAKMVVYTISFLTVVLFAVPYGFHELSELVYPASLHAWLAPGAIQRTLGGVLAVGGLAGYVVCSLWLVIVGRGPFVEFDPPTRFVATGPYRWMRNPVAAMLLVTVLGEAVYLGSAGVLTLFALSLCFAQYQVTRIEEPRLRERFGEDYLEYCRRVSRWWPRPPAR